MKNNLAVLALAVSLTTISTMNLGATTVSVLQSSNDKQDSAGYYVGPYTGTIDGLPVGLIFCDDLNHNINFGEVVSVNVSTINDLSQTRFGGVSGATSLYEQVFYLSTFLADPAHNSDRADIQDAMWSFFSTSAPNQDKAEVKGWLTQASANYASGDYSGFRILTDSNDRLNGKQELFTNTPEPATWAMLLTGVSGLVVGRLRRKKA